MYGPSYRPNVVCFFTILVFLFCFGSAFAQDNDTPESVDGVLLAVDDSADAPTEDDYDDDDDDKDDKADDSDYDSDDGYSSRRYYQADASVKALETKVKDLEKKLEEQEKDNKIASARAKALAAKMEVLKQETEKSVKESLFDWSLFLAMDVMMAETEADPSGLSIKKASILIEKEVLDGKMQFVLEPEYAYDGAQNDHHARFGTALVDISLLDRNASATEKTGFHLRNRIRSPPRTQSRPPRIPVFQKLSGSAIRSPEHSLRRVRTLRRSRPDDDPLRRLSFENERPVFLGCCAQALRWTRLVRLG